MWETLNQISDEVGGLKLDDNWTLRYEGWGRTCIPAHYKTEEAMTNYAIRQAPKIWKEWNTKMRRRGYKPILQEHDEHLGLYGVTYALYERRQ